MTMRLKPIQRQPSATEGEPTPEVASLQYLEQKKVRPNNFLLALGNSPKALAAYMEMSASIRQVRLGTKLRERISLAVAQFHQCGYCLSAHVFSAGRAGLDADAIAQARDGHATDAHEDAAIALALAIVEARGRVTNERLAAARTAGVTDEEIVEIIAVVANMTFSNYLNLVGQPDLDIPAAPSLPVEAYVETTR